MNLLLAFNNNGVGTRSLILTDNTHLNTVPFDPATAARISLTDDPAGPFVYDMREAQPQPPTWALAIAKVNYGHTILNFPWASFPDGWTNMTVKELATFSDSNVVTAPKGTSKLCGVNKGADLPELMTLYRDPNPLPINLDTTGPKLRQAIEDSICALGLGSRPWTPTTAYDALIKNPAKFLNTLTKDTTPPTSSTAPPTYVLPNGDYSTATYLIQLPEDLLVTNICFPNSRYVIAIPPALATDCYVHNLTKDMIANARLTIDNIPVSNPLTAHYGGPTEDAPIPEVVLT